MSCLALLFFRDILASVGMKDGACRFFSELLDILAMQEGVIGGIIFKNRKIRGMYMKKFAMLIILLALLTFGMGITATAEGITATAEGITATAEGIAATAEGIAATAEEGYTYSITESDGVYYFLKGGAVTSESDSLSELLAPLSRLGEPIYMDGVTAAEPIFLTDGNYTLAGTLCASGGITVSEGCQLTLDSICLELSSACLTVSGGSLKLNSGSVSSSATAVTLALTSSAEFVMRGGEIITASSSPALDIVTGTALLYGGRVINGAGAAISARGTLRLAGDVTVSGASYGIIAYNSLWASIGEEYFTGNVTVKYMSRFDEGTETKIVYGTAEGMTDRFTLFDSLGREYLLTSRSGALTVYLPYTVRFVALGSTVYTCEMLSGQNPSPPDYSAPEGYSLGGWYTDPSCRTRYDFATELTGDLTLYAGCTLDSPIYSLQSLSFIYDGLEHTLSFTELYHPLDGIYTYEWLDIDGATVATSDTLSVSEVAQSGRYKCKVLFTFGSDTVMLETPYVNITVTPLVIPVPEIPAVSYNGRMQYPELVERGFTYTPTGFTDSGVYYISLTVTDLENTVFENGTAEALARFEILSADNAWINELSVSDTYFGAEINAVADARFGSVSYMYSLSHDGEYTLTPPEQIGAYYVKAFVPATHNYKYLESEPIRFSILEDLLVSFTPLTYPTVGVYSAFELFDPTGVSFSAIYASGLSATVLASEVSFRYMSADSFRTADSGIIAEYMGQSLLLPITVVAAQYGVAATLNSASVIYDGGYHTLTLIGNLPTGLDGVTPTYRITGGGTDVGEYAVTLEFFTDSLEYSVPAPVTAYLNIEPREVCVEWGETVFVYDGSVKCPIAHYTDIYGARVPLEVTGAVSLAGENYLAAARSPSDNYTLLDGTVAFTVLRADYDLSGVTWSIDTTLYDGTAQTVRLLGLPTGVTALGYVNNTATNAGVYRASVTLSYDTENYNEPRISDHEWQILPISYDLSGFGFYGGSFVYDGSVHFPTLTGDLPTGLDGSSPTYAFSRGVTGVKESGSVTVVFISGSVNYLTPDPIEVTVTVLPRGINVVWSDTVLVYNAQAQAPSAYTSECLVRVEGGSINVGEYTACAYSESADYTVLNSTCSYRITPAPNLWIEKLSVSDIFLGQTPTPTASALHGTVSFSYFYDEALTARAGLPLPVGEYYVVATADAGMNFLSLTSAPVKISVVAILPVSLEASGGREYTAFDTVSDGDFVFTAVNNDGSRRRLSLGELSVIYESASGFRAGDSSVIFEYSGISVTVGVSVRPAEYDMSGVYWSGISHVYDGTAKYAELAGLPQGVTVDRYVGVGAIGAGEYELSAILSYDSENYLPPVLPEAKLVIEKCPLTPSCAILVYNGAVQYPVSDNPLLMPESVGFTDAGEYTVGFILADPDNYTLTEDSASLIILPMRLAVTVGDEVEYWLAPARDFDMEITEGAPVAGDDLMLRFYIENGRIFVTSDNPNYTLSVSSGRLDSRFGFTPTLTRIIFIWLLVLLLICFMTVAVILRREAILAYIASRRTHRIEPSDEPIEHIPMGEYLSVDVERADELITDGIAKTLIREEESIFTEGNRRVIINVDTLSEHFIPGERVDINVLKARGLIPADAGYLKVLGRGVIDKPLSVYANAFSLAAVKMLALTGGEVYRVRRG